jgi:Tfp pilus assembly protein FimT
MTRPRQPKMQEQGVTMTEPMVVLAMAAVTVPIAAPPFRDLFENQRRRGNRAGLPTLRPPAGSPRKEAACAP